MIYRKTFMALVLPFILAACNNTEAQQEKSQNTEAKNAENKTDVKTEVKEQESKTQNLSKPLQILKIENEGTPIKGGTLNVALISDTPFSGILNSSLYSGAPDAALIDYFEEDLLETDENFRYTSEGAASVDFDVEKKQVTIRIKDGINWSDGEPVVADDYIYNLELIAHPDYTGVRFSNIKDIVGAEEFRQGKTQKIEGVEKIDEKTVRVTFKRFTPSIKISGGFWTKALPKHYLGQIPVKDLEKSPQVREKPIGFGPFIVQNVVPGESVRYVKNPNYWRGEPKLDAVVVRVVPESQIVAALKAGQYDVVSMPSSIYETYKDLKNIKLLMRPEFAYTYIGFKLGTWNSEKKEIQVDPNAKMANLSLRKAFGYALDNDLVGKRFYNGLRYRANSAIIPVFKDLYKEDLEGYYYNPKKSKELLASAGYKDIDGDGFVEDPNGNQISFNLASMSGGAIAEPLAQYFIQSWKDVGLNVKLTGGRLMDFNSFYDRVQKDDKEIDIYVGAWGTSSDPSPSGLYSRNSAFNYTRWSDPKNDELLEKIDSEKSLDETYRANAFKEWQEYFSDQASIIPILFRTSVTAVNNRVKAYDVTPGKGIYLHQIELLSEKAAVD